MLSRYALISLGLHALVILAAVFGILSYDTDVVDFPQPISVEIIDTIEDTAKTPEPMPDLPEPPKPDPKNVDSPQLPPKAEAEPEPTPEPEATPEPIPTPIPEPLAAPIEKPEVVKELISEPKPIIPTPKPKPKPPEQTKKTQPKPKPTNDFDALLKNLTNSESAPKQRSGEASDHLAASELDIIRKQFESVWRIPAEIKDIHILKVKIRISMNQDRTVRTAKVVGGSNTLHPSFRILAESALRAVYEFKTTPLKLPPNRYKVWKDINIELEPKHLL